MKRNAPGSVEPLVSVEELTRHFPIKKGLLRRTTGYIRAVDGITFDVRHGETLALVGESGCGKTTVARTLLRLLEPTSGRIVFNGEDVAQLNRQQLLAFRRRAQIIFQDPFGSLNPRMTVGSVLEEVIRVHGLAEKGGLQRRVTELLGAVGLDPADARRYPHQFSGGQRQRIVIARALAVEPEFIVADEPVSALDVSVQAQVLNLLADLQERFHLTYLFVSHDLSVVRHIADRVAVMYLGKIVEIGDSETLFENPQHPYTEALLSAVAVVGAADDSRPIVLSGELPSPANPPRGCPFHPRCPHPEKDEVCRTTPPPLEAKAGGGMAACHKVVGRESGDLGQP